MKIKHKCTKAQAGFAYMVVSATGALMITGAVYYYVTFNKINRIDKDVQKIKQLVEQIDSNIQNYLM